MPTTVPNIVCIPTAGRGTRMGDFADVVNKALLPLGEKAIVSRIIEGFPKGTQFVIALGYKGGQVRDYLELAHPDVAFRFVEVDNHDGPGSGPGYSVLCCREALDRPFFFVPCDCLYTIDFAGIPEGNWVGVSDVERAGAEAYCNFVLADGRVAEIHDKVVPDAPTFVAFTGLLFVRDHELFWSSLAEAGLVAGEHQISAGLLGLAEAGKLGAEFVEWRDIGDSDRYRAAQKEFVDFDFGKTDEFFYRFDDRVVKFFADSNIVAARVAKTTHKPEVFPTIDGVREQFYSYRFVPGETLYTINDERIFSDLLDWLECEVWTSVEVSQDRMNALCREFYFDKTMARLAAFNAKYPDHDEPARVNGRSVPAMSALLETVPWDELFGGIPVFMHGDLQFDNILFDGANDRFWLLDWRQDFAGETAYGDLYYDLAKLRGGITLNYDYIKANRFAVERHGDNLLVDIPQRTSGPHLTALLEEWVEQKGLSNDRVRILTGLIYLNMSPLHHSPFDIALMGLARAALADVLGVGGT